MVDALRWFRAHGWFPDVVLARLTCIAQAARLAIIAYRVSIWGTLRYPRARVQALLGRTIRDIILADDTGSSSSSIIGGSRAGLWLSLVITTMTGNFWVVDVDGTELGIAARLDKNVVTVWTARLQVVFEALLRAWPAKIIWGRDADREYRR
jgi:hypothetical protein